MTGFALYRLPYEGQVTLVAQKEGEPLELPSIAALNGQTGFVVAPFSISPSCPLVLIRPDVVQTFPSYRECAFVGAGLSQAVRRPLSSGETTSLNRDTYADDFRRFFAGMTSAASLPDCPTDVSVNWCSAVVRRCSPKRMPSP